MAGYTTRADSGEIVFGPDDFLVYVLDTDQTVTNSASVVTIPQFTIPVGVNERYLLRYSIYFTTTATGDFKYIVDAPASPTLYRNASWGQGGAATTITSPAVATAEGEVSVLGTGTDGFLLSNVLLVNGSTAGNVLFRFAQATATAAESAIVRAGSFVEIRKF